jgi:membrane-associated phospholipid phosphatase
MGEMNELVALLAQQARVASLDPTLAFLSALGSFPMGVYYARFIGEAALRERAGWDRTLAAFLIAAPLAKQAAGLLDGGEVIPSEHAAFVACLVGVLWRHTDRQTRVILLTFAAAVGVARVLLAASTPIEVVIGYIVGLAVAWFARRLVEMTGTVLRQVCQR